MAVTYNTQAIVLRREDWNGNDARLTLYTQARGKIEAVAKGVRKAKSKLAAHLEPLTTAEIFVVEGRRFPIVAGSSVKNRHEAISASLSRLTTAGLLMRLTDLMTPLESHDNRIFDLLSQTLTALEEASDIGEADAVRITHMFAWKVLVFSGYHAELRTCLECHIPIAHIARKASEKGRGASEKATACLRAAETGSAMPLADEPRTGLGVTRTPSEAAAVAVDVRRGGVIHVVCLENAPHTILVSFPAIKGLAYMVEAPIQDAFRLRSENGALQEMNALIEAMVEERFEVGAGSRFWAVV